MEHRSLASWLLDMSVQNFYFVLLFNKKNNMKYFKYLSIGQMLATSIQLFAYSQCLFDKMLLNHAYGNA